MGSHQRHTDLVDEWRRSLDIAQTKIYRRLKHNVHGTIDILHPYGLDRRADAYVFLNDGFGAIPVECGSMRPDGKWNHCTDTDGLPIRVLRLSFDYGLWILNPRVTEIEELYVTTSREYFEDLKRALLVRPSRS